MLENLAFIGPQTFLGNLAFILFLLLCFLIGRVYDLLHWLTAPIRWVVKRAKGHPTDKGFTMVELMIVLAIVGIIAVMLFGALNRRGGFREAAEAGARDWASHVQNVTNVTCVDMDTDGDGYVSCTVYRDKQDPIFIECSVWQNNQGCRQPKGPGVYYGGY